jgi:predicted DNA-binding transcriptional regulator YafY
MFSGKPTDVILECDNNVMDSIIDRFGENVEVIRNDDKCFDIRINVVANHVLYSWIFGFGGKVKIKSPDYIQNAYLNMLEDAVASIRST